jgi:hypothetical protein
MVQTLDPQQAAPEKEERAKEGLASALEGIGIGSSFTGKLPV